MQRLSPAILILTFLLGCSGEPEGPPVYPVKGKLTLDGEVLAGASVNFYPDKGPMASAISGDNGEFTLKAVAGRHKVLVSKFEGGTEPSIPGEDADGVVGAAGADLPTEGAEEAAESKSLVPKVYTTLTDTPLTAEVKEVEADVPNEVNLNLSSSL